MEMTDKDWELYMAEWSRSLAAEYGSGSPKPVPAKPTPAKAAKEKANQVLNYKWIEKETHKAKFYVTHDTLTELHGFWCPKSAIIKDGSMTLEVAHWCKLKTIQFM